MAALRYDGRVAIITGAGRGIGRAHAELLAARGARVVVNDLGGSIGAEGSSPEPALEVVTAIRAAGGEAVADFSDVSTEAGANALVGKALDSFGRLDIVIANAGNHRSMAIEAMSTENFESLIRVHLFGHFLVTRAAWPHLAAQNYGRVVMTTSPTGYFGNPLSANYAAAKGGIHGLMRSLAQHGKACGITVNAIAPSAYTRIIDNLEDEGIRRMLETLRPEHISPVAAWLAHEDCQTTGEVFAAAGGVVARVIISETEGFTDRDLTIESVRDNFAQIMDESHLRTPQTAPEALSAILDRLRQAG